MRAGEGRHGSCVSKRTKTRGRTWGSGERGDGYGLGVRAKREGGSGWIKGVELTGGSRLPERGGMSGQPAGSRPKRREGEVHGPAGGNGLGSPKEGKCVFILILNQL
jgi:hypothetical protein